MKRISIVLFLLALPFVVFAEGYITKDLYFGLRNDPEVVKLQKFLKGQGHFTYPVATGNYFTATIDAVKKFQKANNFKPIGGFFGEESRRAVDQIIAMQQAAIPPPVPAPAPIPTPISGGGSFTPSPFNSPYKGKIAIENFSGSGETAESEFIVLTNKTQGERISITGFTINNGRGESVTIPRGSELPGFDQSGQDPIALRPGDRVTIAIGKQERGMNFRQNLCTGYFDELSRFTPSLNHQCLKPETRSILNLSDACIRKLNGVQACRRPPLSEDFDPECSNYAFQHYNYAGCVSDFRARPDFYSNEWVVWMQRSNEFFRNRFETMTIRDERGLLVDQKEYQLY